MSEPQSSWLQLKASDGATISAYHLKPSGKRRGGLVVVQEIFGVNSHIRGVAERYAALGFEVLAPAFFDRVESGVELGYDESGFQKGRALVGQIGFEKPLLDIAAAVQKLAESGGKVGLVGYCWGGTVAFLAAAKVPTLSASVGYYGSTIPRFVTEAPKMPLLLHFGEQDKSLPMAEVEKIREQRPDAEVHVYDAGHGFNCEQRPSYDERSATLALERTLAFFDQHLA